MNKVNQDRNCPKCGRPVSAQMSYCAACGARIFRGTSGENTVDPYLGQVIDNTFEVESILGTGSMGIVYKARHRALDCYVALKILRHDLLSDRVVLARFQREAQAASKLSHPNVIRILHYGKTALNAPYIAMECLEGMELGVLVPREFPLDQRRVCSIILQTARALSAAHAANIVHRDLKPANIFVIHRDGMEQVKVLDFGIAKVADIEGEGLTKEGAMCGTPAFMSPEQVLGQKVTYASDLFSLGSVMYYLLTCRLPFQGDNMVDVARTILASSPVPPSQTRLDCYVDPHLNAICMKALEKDIDKRYQTALEMVADLENAYNQIPIDSIHQKPKIIVGAPQDDDNLGATTQCMMPAYQDGGDSDLDGGTVVEMPAMRDDEAEVMSTAKSGIGSALGAFGQAVSEVFSVIQPTERMLAPNDKTIVGASSMPDPVPLDEETARELLLEQRKRLMLKMVLLISTLSLLAIIIVIIFLAVRDDEEDVPQDNVTVQEKTDTTSSEDNSKADATDPAPDTDDQEIKPTVEPEQENSDPDADKGDSLGTDKENNDSDASQDPAPSSDDSNDTPSNEMDWDDSGDDTADDAPPPVKTAPAKAKSSKSKSKTSSSKTSSKKPTSTSSRAPSSSSPSGTQSSTSKNNRVSLDDEEENSSSKSSKSKAGTDPTSKNPTVTKKLAEAQKLEKAENTKRACEIYKEISNIPGIEQSTLGFVQKKIRECKRTEERIQI